MKKTIKILIYNTIFTLILTAVFLYVKQENPEEYLWGAGFGAGYCIAFFAGNLMIKIQNVEFIIKQDESKSMQMPTMPSK